LDFNSIKDGVDIQVKADCKQNLSPWYDKELGAVSMLEQILIVERFTKKLDPVKYFSVSCCAQIAK